jgi:O-antigen/teichoic acid export membrane protein
MTAHYASRRTNRADHFGLSGAWAGFARCLALGGAVAGNVLLARLLTPGDVGAYFTIAALIPVAAVLCSAGLDRFVVVEATARVAEGDFLGARYATGQCIRLAAKIAIGCVPILAVVVWLGVGAVLDERLTWLTGLVAALWIGALALRTVLSETFRAFHRFRAASLYNGGLENALIAGCLAIVFATGLHLRLPGALTVSLAAVVLVGIGAFVHSKPLRDWNSPPAKASVLRPSIAIMGASLSLFVLGAGIDLLTLSIFRHDTDVAYYGAAARLASLLIIGHGVMLSALPSFIVHFRATSQGARLQELVRASTSLAALPALLLFVIYVAAGPYIMSTVYGQAYRAGWAVLVILGVANLATVLTGPSALTLTLAGHAGVVMRCSFLIGCSMTITGFLSAWQWGAVGLAATTCLGIIAQNVWLMWMAHSRLGLITVPTLSGRRTIRALKVAALPS